jgi:hypothetical protein
MEPTIYKVTIFTALAATGNAISNITKGASSA